MKIDDQSTNEKTNNLETLNQIKTEVRKQSGLIIENEKKLQAAILKRIEALKISDYHTYLSLITGYNAAISRELFVLAEDLVNTESYFYRDAEQIEWLKQEILPDLIARNQNAKKLHIWSAGCAKGEELYTLAFLLADLLPSLKNWNLLMIGTDISYEAIRAAKKGEYNENSFRETSKSLRLKYFDQLGEAWRVKQSFIETATFKQSNLFSLSTNFENMPPLQFDLIICRNVFIYMQPKAIESIIAKFAQKLTKSGYIMTGRHELHGSVLPPNVHAVKKDLGLYQKKGF